MRYAWKQIHEKLNQIQTNIYRGTTTQISIIYKKSGMSYIELTLFYTDGVM